jgi:hypothetical protein
MILPQPDEANFAKNKKWARKEFCLKNEQWKKSRNIA